MTNVPFSPPDIGETEIEAVVKVLKSGWITTGPQTKEFERRVAAYCGTESAVALNSATSALELTLRLLGVGPGDEVITSAYTYTASASVIHHVGARIVLVDTAIDSYHLDVDALESAINSNTKAIIPVDIAGIMCDYDKIRQIVDSRRNVFSSNSVPQEALGRIAIIADAAHSFGALSGNFRSGQSADFTCFSFHAVKNLITAEGGAVTWRSDLGLSSNFLYRQYMLLSLHGQDKDALSKSKAAEWEYDILVPGYKANMTDISAALGLVQLDRYPNLLDRRHDVIKRYNRGIAASEVAPVIHEGSEFRSSGHLYLVNLGESGEERRNELIRNLAAAGVSANVHYKPLPMLTAYRNLGFNISDYPRAEKRYKNEISLPLFSKISNLQVDHVISCFNQLAAKGNNLNA